MEHGAKAHSWHVDGCYANWTLTLTVEPAEDVESVEVPVEDFRAVADHFDTTVNRIELGHDLDMVCRDMFRSIG